MTYIKTIDFLADLKPGENRLYEILKIERIDGDLTVVLGCSDGESASTCLKFSEVSAFDHTLFGAPGDSDNLPQTLIGFDYWPSKETGTNYNWEINGDECCWNFSAALPTVTAC